MLSVTIRISSCSGGALWWVHGLNSYSNTNFLEFFNQPKYLLKNSGRSRPTVNFQFSRSIGCVLFFWADFLNFSSVLVFKWRFAARFGEKEKKRSLCRLLYSVLSEKNFFFNWQLAILGEHDGERGKKRASLKGDEGRNRRLMSDYKERGW